MSQIKPLKVDLPYPDLECIEKDLYTGRVLSFAYATQESELGAILQYTYHSFCFSLFDKSCQELLESIAMVEMEHLNLLGRALAKLGINPLFVHQPPLKQNFFNTGTLAYVTEKSKMLKANLEGELNAIAGYKKIISLITNKKIIELVNRIIMDEELHVKALQDALGTKKSQQE